MNRGRFNRRKPKLQGRGTLQAIESNGPLSDWLGMPDYYIHTLTVDDESYRYLTADATLDVTIGDNVCFRYQEVGEERRIDRRSLGIAIDPSTFN